MDESKISQAKITFTKAPELDDLIDRLEITKEPELLLLALSVQTDLRNLRIANEDLHKRLRRLEDGKL